MSGLELQLPLSKFHTLFRFTGFMVGKVGKACAAAIGGSLLLINVGFVPSLLFIDLGGEKTECIIVVILSK